jgi:mannitol/fructose-specific phosphotransferase system IIA component (Ntr-type)
VNPLSELVAQPDVVVSELGAATAEGAIANLHARLCADTPAVKDGPGFLAALLQRARMDSVAIASDVAIPHARTDAVERMVLAVGRSSGGIAFDPAHPRVRLVFLIGAPRQQVGEYLQVVATISRLLRREGAREALLAAGNEDELRAILGRTINVAV